MSENPQITPIGFEDSKGIYRLADIARALGITEIDMLSRIKNTSNIKILPACSPAGTTIH